MTATPLPPGSTRRRDMPAGGPWTRHGHVIPGVTVAGSGRPPVARCGGVPFCRKCAADAGEYGVAPERSPAPSLSATEAARVASFDAAPPVDLAADAREEAVAEALWISDIAHEVYVGSWGIGDGWVDMDTQTQEHYRRLADAALAAADAHRATQEPVRNRHNHVRWQNSGESWSPCPPTCPSYAALAPADHEPAAAIQRWAAEAIREVHQCDNTEPPACDWCGEAWPCAPIRAVSGVQPAAPAEDEAVVCSCGHPFDEHGEGRGPCLSYVPASPHPTGACGCSGYTAAPAGDECANCGALPDDHLQASQACPTPDGAPTSWRRHTYAAPAPDTNGRPR